MSKEHKKVMLPEACPYCGTEHDGISDDQELSDDGSMLTSKFWCDECDKKWTAIYNLQQILLEKEKGES